jgi:hypothetical protein
LIPKENSKEVTEVTLQEKVALEEIPIRKEEVETLTRISQTIIITTEDVKVIKHS